MGVRASRRAGHGRACPLWMDPVRAPREGRERATYAALGPSLGSLSTGQPNRSHRGVHTCVAAGAPDTAAL